MAKKPTKLQKSEVYEARMDIENAIDVLNNSIAQLYSCGYDGTAEIVTDLEDIVTTLDTFCQDLTNIIRGGDTE